MTVSQNHIKSPQRNHGLGIYTSWGPLRGGFTQWIPAVCEFFDSRLLLHTSPVAQPAVAILKNSPDGHQRLPAPSRSSTATWLWKQGPQKKVMLDNFSITLWHFESIWGMYIHIFLEKQPWVTKREPQEVTLIVKVVKFIRNSEILINLLKWLTYHDISIHLHLASRQLLWNLAFLHRLSLAKSGKSNASHKLLARCEVSLHPRMEATSEVRSDHSYRNHHLFKGKSGMNGPCSIAMLHVSLLESSTWRIEITRPTSLGSTLAWRVQHSEISNWFRGWLYAGYFGVTFLTILCTGQQTPGACKKHTKKYLFVTDVHSLKYGFNICSICVDMFWPKWLMYYNSKFERFDVYLQTASCSKGHNDVAVGSPGRESFWKNFYTAAHVGGSGVEQKHFCHGCSWMSIGQGATGLELCW